MATPALDRSLGLLHATAMVVGIIVGASIFVQPSEISRRVPSITGMLVVWLLSGALTLCGALVCAELSAAFPRSGGVYVFLRETVSPAAGFLWGWAMFWTMHSGIIAAIAVVFAGYAGYFVPLGADTARFTAMAAVVGLSAINYLGVRPGGIVQTSLTIFKILSILLILILVFALARGGPAASTAVTPPAPQPALSDFLLAIGAGLFAFGGWHMVTYAADETIRPGKTIPRALVTGVFIVTFCYLALNAAYLRVLPLEQLIRSTRVAADAAMAVVGPKGAAAISALVIVSSLGALNGIILAGPRVYYAMSRDGLAFQWAGAIHPRFRTPHLAILAQAACSCVLVATGTYRSLFTRVIYTEWIFFAAMTIGLMRLRKSGGWPLARDLLFLAGCAIIVVNQIVADPRESAAGLLLVAAGLPIYYVWARRAGTEKKETAVLGHH